VIDAHQHFLDPGRLDYPWMSGPYERLHRTFLPGDLSPALDAAGVDRAIAVQACNDLRETFWLLRIAATDPRSAGVVGWVDLTDPAVGDVLAELRGRPGGDRLVGIRHLVHDEQDSEWLLRPDVSRGLTAIADAGLVFDLLVRTRELPAASVVVDRHPDLSFVIDHLAKPPIVSGLIEHWAALLRPLGDRDHVAAKLSGLITEADWERWSAADLAPAIDLALEVFGPDRLMFGSDWPVCLLAASYDRVVGTLADALDDLSASERATIFAGTATRVYGLT